MSDAPDYTRSLTHENPAPETQAPTGRPGAYAKYRIVRIGAGHGRAGYYVLEDRKGWCSTSTGPPLETFAEAIRAVNALVREANNERD